MKDFKNDSTSTLSRFGRDKRERTASPSAERVERAPRPQRDAADSEPRTERRSYNPNFSADNRPIGGGERRNFDDKPRYGDKPAYGEKRSFGDKPSFGDRDRKPYGDRENKPYGERKSFGDKPSFGDRDRKPYGDKPSFGDRDRKPYGDKPSFGDRDRKPYGDKPSFGDRDRKPYGDKPSFGDRDRKPYGDKPSFGDRDRKPYGDKPSFGDRDRKPYGDKPSFGDRDRKPYGDRPSFGDRDRKPYGDKPSFGDRDRKPYGDKPSFGDRDRKPYGDRPSFGDRDRKPYGDRPSFGDRDRKPYGDRDRKPYGDRERKPYGDRPSFARDSRRDEKPTNYPSFDPNKQEGEMRLNRYIAQSGLGSRREADEFITSGLVSVNGQIITELGTKVMPNDEVKYNDNVIQGEKKVYLVLNKPKGFVTTIEDPHADKTVMDLVRTACTERIYPVGRLDKNSLGLLLFTNDGDLTKQLTHPSYLKKKIYQVSLDKALERGDMDLLVQGITLEDGEIHCDEVAYVKDNKKEVGLEIHSGRNRIVRRMFEHLGYSIGKLDRVYYAGLTKKNLKRGEWRFLSREEVERLKSGQYE